jgi:hypothetical protein
VTGAHPKGLADYDRFVRKHDRYFALAESGDIASGVTHVDPALSPFSAPDPATLDELNARSPEGTGILAAQRGDDPFAVTTQIRTLWRLAGRSLPGLPSGRPGARVVRDGN